MQPGRYLVFAEVIWPKDEEDIQYYIDVKDETNNQLMPLIYFDGCHHEALDACALAMAKNIDNLGECVTNPTKDLLENDCRRQSFRTNFGYHFICFINDSKEYNYENDMYWTEASNCKPLEAFYEEEDEPWKFRAYASQRDSHIGLLMLMNDASYSFKVEGPEIDHVGPKDDDGQ